MHRSRARDQKPAQGARSQLGLIRGARASRTRSGPSAVGADIGAGDHASTPVSNRSLLAVPGARRPKPPRAAGGETPRRCCLRHGARSAAEVLNPHRITAHRCCGNASTANKTRRVGHLRRRSPRVAFWTPLRPTKLRCYSKHAGMPLNGHAIWHARCSLRTLARTPVFTALTVVKVRRIAKSRRK